MTDGVVPFSIDLHLHDAVASLMAVRGSDPTYPPPIDVDCNSNAFSQWLMKDPALNRWAAVSAGKAVGHVQLTEAHDYMVKFLESCEQFENGLPVAEIGKLFVDPRFAGRGLGLSLLEAARAGARESERMPCLAVVTTSPQAIRFYAKAGLLDIGGFEGIHGENRVMVALE